MSKKSKKKIKRPFQEGIMSKKSKKKIKRPFKERIFYKLVKEKLRKIREEYFHGQLVFIIKYICLIFAVIIIFLVMLSLIAPSSCNAPKNNPYSGVIINTMEKANRYLLKDGSDCFNLLSGIDLSFREINSRILNYYCGMINYHKVFLYLQFRSFIGFIPVSHCFLPPYPLYGFIVITKDCSEQKEMTSSVGDLLTGTQNLIEFIALIAAIIAVIFGVFGAKWLKNIWQLRKTAEEGKKALLRAAVFTYHSLPDLSKPQIIPDKYTDILKQWNTLYTNADFSKIIDQNSEFGCIRFASALYQASDGYYDRAIKIIEDKIIADPSITERHLIYDSYYKLAIFYRREQKFPESWRAYDKLPDEEMASRSFGKAVTAFMHFLSFGVYNDDEKWEKMEEYDYAGYTGMDLVQLIKYIFIEILYGSLLFSGRSYRVFLLPEYLYFLYRYLNKKDEETANVIWKGLFNYIIKIDNYPEGELREDIQKIEIKELLPEVEKKTEYSNRSYLYKMLSEFSKRTIDDKSVHFTHSESDNDVQANMNYCFALMHYYRSIESKGKKKEKDVNEARKHLGLALYHANNAKFIFSELSQADVSKSVFKDKDVKYLADLLE